MSTQSMEAPQPHVPSAIPVLNRVISRLLRLGMPFGPNVLLTVRGRSSGVARTFPVAILDHDGRRFVQSPFGEVNWVRNLRASGEALLTRGRRREEVTATELAPDDAARILRDALAPFMRRRAGAALVSRFFHVRPDSTLDEFVAEARQHPMFELRPR